MIIMRYNAPSHEKRLGVFYIRIAFYATVFCEAVHFCAATSIVLAARF